MKFQAGPLTLTSSLVLLTSVGHAQSIQQIQRVDQELKDGGAYHLATRTWSRAGDHASPQGFSKVLYNNTPTLPIRFFGTANQPIDIHWTDEGRLPSTSGHTNAKADAYVVQAFQVAYCAGGVPGPVTLGVDFYERYTVCMDPRALQSSFSTGMATVPGFVPNGGNIFSCWTITFDLTGTSLEFPLRGDGDGAFDGTSSLDNFGWQIHLSNGQQALRLGPLLAYDPQGYFGCAAAEGDGTYYQSGSCSSPYGFGNYGSGLSSVDMHYSWSPQSSQAEPNGCYWFNGYSSTGPASSFYMVVYGDNQGGLGDNYCTGNPNSVGSGGSIAMNGTGSVGAADTEALASGVPNQAGVFFHAANQIATSFGCGLLCAGGGIRRGNVVFANNNVASYLYDESTSRRSLAGFESTTRNFQFWYRDPMNSGACGNTFNLTDAIAVPITP